MERHIYTHSGHLGGLISGVNGAAYIPVSWIVWALTSGLSMLEGSEEPDQSTQPGPGRVYRVCRYCYKNI